MSMMSPELEEFRRQLHRQSGGEPSVSHHLDLSHSDRHERSLQRRRSGFDPIAQSRLSWLASWLLTLGFENPSMLALSRFTAFLAKMGFQTLEHEPIAIRQSLRINPLKVLVVVVLEIHDNPVTSTIADHKMHGPYLPAWV